MSNTYSLFTMKNEISFSSLLKGALIDVSLMKKFEFFRKEIIL